ncbi:HalOD1 output domain-containing protein [Haladaptatus sp. NG-WS-4]
MNDSAIVAKSVLVERDIEARERPSEAVVRAVADAASCDPLELTQPLYNAIDTDALDALWSTRRPQLGGDLPSVQFEYDEYEVTVRENRSVVVHEAASDSGR